MDSFPFKETKIEALYGNNPSPMAFKQNLLDTNFPQEVLNENNEPFKSPETSNTDNVTPNSESPFKKEEEENLAHHSSAPKQEELVDAYVNDEELRDERDLSESKGSLDQSCSGESQTLLLNNGENCNKVNEAEVENKSTDIDTLDKKQTVSNFEGTNLQSATQKRGPEDPDKRTYTLENVSSPRKAHIEASKQTPKKVLDSAEDDLLGSGASTATSLQSLQSSAAMNRDQKRNTWSMKNLSEQSCLGNSGQKYPEHFLVEDGTSSIEVLGEEGKSKGGRQDGNLYSIKEKSEISERFEEEAHSQYGQQKEVRSYKQFQDQQGSVRPDRSECEKRDLERKQDEDLTSIQNLKEYQVRQIKDVERLKKLFSEYCSKNQRSHRPLGLRNMGNTCFRNVILQAILHMALLGQYFLNLPNPGPLSYYLKELLSCQRDGVRNSIQQMKILQKIENVIYKKNPSLEPREQQDAIEFMKTFLEILNEENSRIKNKPSYEKLNANIIDDGNIKKNIQEKSHEWYEFGLKREDSIVTDLFGGQILNMTMCHNCKVKKASFDNYWDLTLGFPSNRPANYIYSLKELLENFTRTDAFLDGVYCDNCQGNFPSTYRSSIYKLPEILVIDFKRFKQEHGWGKIQNEIEFPVAELDMSEIVKDSRDISVEDPVYSLFGMVNHSGTLEGGHYTADCMDYITGQWKHFNDTIVRGSNIGHYESYTCSPSILFYIKTSHLNYVKEKSRSRGDLLKCQYMMPIDVKEKLKRWPKQDHTVDLSEDVDDGWCGMKPWFRERFPSFFSPRKEPRMKV